MFKSKSSIYHITVACLVAILTTACQEKHAKPNNSDTGNNEAEYVLNIGPNIGDEGSGGATLNGDEVDINTNSNQ